MRGWIRSGGGVVLGCTRLTAVWAAVVGAALAATAVLLEPAIAQPVRGPSLAQMGGTIADIRIEGAQRIEPETIRPYLLVQPAEAWAAPLLTPSPTPLSA